MSIIRDLPNKPLFEAILELRWHVPDEGDPHYNLFPGRLYDSVVEEYPIHEPLPTSSVPQQTAQQIAQHRFRIQENGWPLIQVGPGVVTLNDTTGYTWTDFGERAKKLVQSIFCAYPKPEELRVTRLLLRYIDAVEVDYAKEDVFHFLGDKLKTNIVIPPALFVDVPVGKAPIGFIFHTAFPVTSPTGTISLRFATSTHQDKPTLVWEIAVVSQGSNLPSLPDGFGEWVESAHALTDDWFFKLIEGELERGFAGEDCM